MSVCSWKLFVSVCVAHTLSSLILCYARGSILDFTYNLPPKSPLTNSLIMTLPPPHVIVLVSPLIHVRRYGFNERCVNDFSAKPAVWESTITLMFFLKKEIEVFFSHSFIDLTCFSIAEGGNHRRFFYPSFRKNFNRHLAHAQLVPSSLRALHENNLLPCSVW